MNELVHALLITNNISAQIDERIGATYFDLDSVRREEAYDEKASTLQDATEETESLTDTQYIRESFSTQPQVLSLFVEQEFNKYSLLAENNIHGSLLQGKCNALYQDHDFYNK